MLLFNMFWFVDIFFPPSHLILGNGAKFFWILWTWLPFPCPSENPQVTLSFHWSAWESFYRLHSSLRLVQIIIWISFHLILCWLQVPVLSAAFLVHYAFSACTLHAKTFLAFETGMCISPGIYRKPIAINHLLRERWNLFFLGAIIWDASVDWENNNIW